MKHSEITYQTERIVETYASAIRSCKTPVQLLVELETNWPYLTDAIEQAKAISELNWKWALKNVKNGNQADRFNAIAGHIFVPDLLIWMMAVTKKYTCTDGTALLRLLALPKKYLDLTQLPRDR